jgi:hypothetical protein
MRAFLAIVSREIRERRALLAAAAVASLLPLLAPLLPSTGTNPPEDIRMAVMWVVLGGLAPLFALLLGIGFIGRDLSEGRLGFYYAQPISGATIWFGKLTAILLLVWVVEIIVVMPTVLLAPDPFYFLLLPSMLTESVPTWLAPFAILIISTFVVLIAHAVGLVWRARSLWLIIDLVACLIAVSFGWLAIRSFVPIVAERIAVGSMYWILGWTMVGLVVGGLVQIVSGRVDLRRSHRFLSASCWSVILVAFGVLLGWTLWVRSAQLDDLQGVYDFSLGSGEWIAVSGTSPGRFDYHLRFLFNVEDGRSVDIGPATNWYGPGLQFSEDGSRAVWPRFEGFDGWVMMSVDLGDDNPTPLSTAVTVGYLWEGFAISGDGERFAVLEERNLAVYGCDEGEQLAAVHIHEGVNPISISFDSDRSIRLLATTRGDQWSDEARWWLYWFDVKNRSLSDPVEIDRPIRWRQRDRDGKSDSPLVRIRTDDGKYALAIRDEQTGEILRDLGSRLYWSDYRLLADDAILVIRDQDFDHHLEIYESDGRLRHRIDLPLAPAFWPASARMAEAGQRRPISTVI